MKNQTTKIEGFTVELTHTDESVCCDISCGRYFGSLASVADSGTLYTADGAGCFPISERAIAKIEQWAIGRGW